MPHGQGGGTLTTLMVELLTFMQLEGWKTFSFFADAMLGPVDFLSLQAIRKSLHDLPGSNFFHSWDFNSDPRGFAGSRFTRIKDLRFLAISRNFIYGEILASLGEVRRLRTLDLSYNQLTGTISPSIGYLPELSNLILCHNHLTGSIPPFLSQSLTRIDLKRNSLTGSISPASLPPSLRYLSLAWNQLTGPVDRVLLQLNQVNYLSDISDTGFAFVIGENEKVLRYVE
ncbi:PREDICTED: probable leucine-rich repeat receptor-like protein kinase At1g35710 [Brassica oleracea var. oleracea]|uniref:probable leucine-rich repeat receptor-like protein kinase At1g35710 n=1 Tax=Brassica oleracea var. oleracea TaxID=109376 RepID=UPI0006A72660|nr:PREDICTED: probable leucine-rich repeat receptor-like protein kinase At1g35710 [Brassica oleracea var. oleracea]